MSALTKEEREFMSVLVYDDRTTPLVSIIDRLVAENEELRKKLTALIEAAQQVGIRYNELAPMLAFVADEEVLLDEAVCNLNKAVKEAKGD